MTTPRSGGQPLRMLQVANQPGPFYCFLRPLVFELMRHGVEVDVACNHTDSRYAKLGEAGMHTLPLDVGPWKSGGTWLTLRRQLREILSRKQYDICVVHTPAISWITRREAARAGVPVVAYTAHGLPFYRQGPLAYRFLLGIEKFCSRYTDLLLLVNSDDARAAEEHHLAKPGGIIRHIPGPGIDVSRWEAAPSAETLTALHAELSLGLETRVIGYMGRLMPTKGVLDLVESLARLTAAGRDVVLVVAGEGELADAMRDLAMQRGVADRLRLLGWRDDTVALMHLSDVLVLPSTYREGLPTVLMEAGAASRPVVAYLNRGSNDIVVDGQTGYLVTAGDVAALTDAIGRIVSDEGLARRMGETGHERIVTTFSFAQGVRAQLDAYADALEARGYDASPLRRDLGKPVFCLDPNCERGGEGGP